MTDSTEKSKGCNFITSKDIEERLKPFFEKFSPLRNNFCADCLGLKEVQPCEDADDKKTCDVYLMDTGICSKCGKTADVLNPFIYATARLNHIDNVWGNAPRIYRKTNTEIYYNPYEQTPNYKPNNMLNEIAEHKKKYKGMKKYLTRIMIMLIIAIPSLFYSMFLNMSNLNIDSSIYNILSVPLQGFIIFLLLLMVNKEMTSISEKRKNEFEDIVNQYKNIQ